MKPSFRAATVAFTLLACSAALAAQDSRGGQEPPKPLKGLLPPPRKPRPGEPPPAPSRLAPTFRMEDVISVRLKPGASLGDILDRAQAEDVRVTPVRPPNRLNVVDLRVAAGNDPSAAAAKVKALPGVDFSETNWVGAYDAVTPNDPLYVYQWNLMNPGGWGLTVDADIDADDAWTRTQGDPSVIIAVIDSGVDWSHPDLDAHVFRNTAEVALGINGVDDDANGFTDDFVGWDFAGGTNDVTSTSAHGTQVAGIIGAVGNNGIGVTGIAGGGTVSVGCQILAIGVGDPDPMSSLLDDAILYAVSAGAKVINLSLSIPPSSSVEAAIRDAVDRGVTVVCAAGNNLSTVCFPASDERVIPVASVGGSGGVSYFSSPGDALKLRGLAAPGEVVPTLTLAGGYTWASGTSFAAPHVTAAVGLVLSVPAGAGLTPDQIRDLLRSTVDPLSIDAQKVGAGRLNLANALSSLGP